MKKFSIALFILGIFYILGCVWYYRDVLNVVDSDTMSVNPAGEMVAKWPIFVGIIMVFVGATFWYAEITNKKA